MRQAGIGLQSRHDLLAGDAQPPAGCPGAGGVLGIVVARQRRRVGEVGRVAVSVDQHAGAEGDAARDRPVEHHRHRADAEAMGDLAVDATRILVVDADHGAVARVLAFEDVLLGVDIARHVAMSVDMVRRDVEPHRDMSAEGFQ